MKFSTFTLSAAIMMPAAMTQAYEHMLKEKRRSLKGFYEAAPGTPLNTRMRETPEQRARRMELFEEGEVAPLEPADEALLEELYNPMLDAKCFNDQYQAPSINKNELYEDYVKIFKWGLENPSESPLFDFSTGVTNNRFPGMCLRMAFHDNAIVDQDADEYVENNIDSATGVWNGPDVLMESSGGDASVLVCKPERFHPNQNYDQTASRVLHAFQSSSNYPQGPGISGGSLMSKYDFSYADALHNCALAAVKFMTETDDAGTVLEIDISSAQKTALANVVDKFSFGRKDACYITHKFNLNSDSLGANSRRPLCGPTEHLPGVTFSAADVNNWFTSRGMPVGIWLSLFGTHSALDNFSDPAIIRNFGLQDKDYFEDFVGCPMHKLRAAVVDPEDGGCDWTPTCKDPANTEVENWLLVQSDCATSIDIIQDVVGLEDLTDQMQSYIDSPGSWLPDIVCALGHFGGDNEDCIGPNAQVNPGGSHSTKFGSFYKNDYPMPPKQPSHGECVYGTWNDQTYECECHGDYGSPGYCHDQYGKCTVLKELDTAFNLFYCEGTETKPSATPCEDVCPFANIFADMICMNGICNRETACVFGTWAGNDAGCECRPGYCKDAETGYCTSALVATHMALNSLGAWEWQYACNALN